MSFIYNPSAGGSGSPGGANTEIQFNNAGAFGGTSGLHWLSGSSELQFDDNIYATFGTGSDARIYYDGTDLIIDSTVSGTGVVRLKADSSGDLILERIGLGGSAITTQYWINFVQTAATGRGALNFDLTTTSANPQSNILSKLTYQGPAASPTVLSGYYQAIDNSDHTGTASVGLRSDFGTAAAQNITQGTKEFFGLKVQHNLGVGDGLHTGGTIRQYGLWIGAFVDYVGVASQLKHGIYCAENISTRAGNAFVFDSTATAMGDTLMTYIAADLALYTDINGTRITEAKADKVTFNVPPENYGISRACVHAMNHYWTR